ncbi:hypothetical protein BXZ70DRAFT_961750 [Cristinia sonorae]|uniref:Uncharacterized protein n=1 Tax=Cristinia sonorae TaxID=1940300 RepID=A0A8K0UDU8_9AGAR|nr:hypothetical protein BXZ70DRAFT_961750 [Cristinia sonorae]
MSSYIVLPPQYDVIRELGVYDQLPIEVQSSLKGLVLLPPSVRDVAHQAISEEVAKPDTQDKLLKEVNDLNDSVIKVDQAFERVRVGLGQVDNNNYTDPNGLLVPKFQPTWVGFQKKWTSLLWGSRDTATGTQAYINDFIKTIIPEVENIKTDADLANARRNLNNFINRRDPFGHQLNSQETIDLAQQHSQEFTDLRREMEAFRNTFDNFAKDREVQLSRDITQKQEEIETLKLEIKKCQTVVMAMGIALGVTVIVTGAGAIGSMAALGPLGPFFALGALIVGAIAAITELGVLIAYVKQLNGHKAALDAAQAQLLQLQAQLQHLHELQAILQGQKEDITYIAGRLDRFASVWGTVRHDAQLINEGLHAAVGDEGSKRAFMRRVALVKDAYSHLGEALALYTANINRSSSLLKHKE